MLPRRLHNHVQPFTNNNLRYGNSIKNAWQTLHYFPIKWKTFAISILFYFQRFDEFPITIRNFSNAIVYYYYCLQQYTDIIILYYWYWPLIFCRNNGDYLLIFRKFSIEKLLYENLSKTLSEIRSETTILWS